MPLNSNNKKYQIVRPTFEEAEDAVRTLVQWAEYDPFLKVEIV